MKKLFNLFLIGGQLLHNAVLVSAMQQHEPAMLLLLSCFSHVQLFVTPWTVARQAPLSVGFPRQEYWSGLPFSSPMHESEK